MSYFLRFVTLISTFQDSQLGRKIGLWAGVVDFVPGFLRWYWHETATKLRIIIKYGLPGSVRLRVQLAQLIVAVVAERGRGVE